MAVISILDIQHEIHVGDVGTVFEATIRTREPDGTTPLLDLTSNAGLTWVFKTKGHRIVRAGTVTSPGTSGTVKYVGVTADWIKEGIYRAQVQVQIVAPDLTPGIWKTDIGEFEVFPNL